MIATSKGDLDHARCKYLLDQWGIFSKGRSESANLTCEKYPVPNKEGNEFELAQSRKVMIIRSLLTTETKTTYLRVMMTWFIFLGERHGPPLAGSLARSKVNKGRGKAKKDTTG